MNPHFSLITKYTSMLMLCLMLGACSSDSDDSSDNDDTGTTNTSPTVDAGADQTVDADETVSLSAAITDDDTTFTIVWSQTSGNTTVTLDDDSSANPTFTAPSTDTEQTLVFEVSVDDGTNDAVTDSVSITVSAAETGSDTAPTVDAGTDQSVDSAATVTLSAAITDDNDSYTITWNQTSGNSSVTLSDSSAATTTFTAPTVSEDETLVFTVSVDDGVNEVVSDSISITVTAESTNTTDDSVWIMNDTDEVSLILDSTSGVGVLVDVQSVTTETVDGKEYTVVNSQGIPKYDTTITQDIIDTLNDRPKATTDFVTTAPTVSVGDVVEFAEDIGYNSNSNCTTNAGFGSWPPGPDCPTESERTVYLPVDPTPTTEVCENGLNKVGLFVNGSSIFNWGDGMSYNTDGSWQNLAPVAEFYDIDICGGHAANGDYHAHQYTSCLADLVDDNGDKHSPLYGFAADGYPIYGPWESDGVLAVSAWTVRDYSSDSATGCSDNARSCALVDQYDISLGTEEVTDGPAFTDTVDTLSGNVLTAVNGYYFEDHYWDETLTAQGGVYLDQYNAHTDATRGYHYHITIVEDGDSYAAAFPYIIGTRFAGQLEDNSVASCDTGETAGGPPGGGGPP